MLEEQTRHSFVRSRWFVVPANLIRSRQKSNVSLRRRISGAAADRLIRNAVCRVQDSGRLRAGLSFPYKLEQVRIDDIFVSGAHAVGKSRVDLQGGSFHNFRRHKCGDSDRHDLIVVAVHDERWHIELFEIFSKIGLPKRFDAIVDVRKTG